MKSNKSMKFQSFYDSNNDNTVKLRNIQYRAFYIKHI